jgi:hypothetical protein
MTPYLNDFWMGARGNGRPVHGSVYAANTTDTVVLLHIYNWKPVYFTELLHKSVPPACEIATA